MRWNLRRRSAAAATFAAALGAALMVMQPAASAAPAATAAKTVDYSCQARSGGVKTCEWFSTNIITAVPTGAKTTELRAWGSMKGSTSKAITQISSWAEGCLGCEPREEAASNGTAGTGTISSADGWRACAGFYGWRVEFKYKYWLPKPTSAWITGTAKSPWLYNVQPCSSIGGPGGS
jgi:hypothetical protein